MIRYCEWNPTAGKAEELSPGSPVPAARRRLLDVEDALRWAYRDELPKRGAGASSGVSPMFSLIAYGTHVDNSNREPGFPAALGEPHPDAILIEQAVAALDRFSGFTVAGADLGTGIGFVVDQDRAVRHATAGMVGQIVVHARMGNRPVCHPPAFSCGPAIGPNGKPKVSLTVTAVNQDDLIPTPWTFDEPAKATRAGRYPTGAFCPLTWTPTPTSVIEERADYLAWWLGLDQLARDLSLASIAVLAPSAPMRPWAGDRERGKPPALFRPDAPVYRAVRTAAEAARSGAAQRRRGERRPPGAPPPRLASVPGRGNGGRQAG